ncbi:MAG: hypothetical protein CVU78_01295 [Elusimicrobia bacterium HGW-Elusimicrobia-2]|nr:MAG: hypothetical protein CVU78_01295 [Elusimicrobia bacterium HGW-Elusimicrobia-2]
MIKKTGILLIDPPWEIESSHNIWKNIGSCLPSLGLAYIASYLEKNGFGVSIIDCTAERIGLQRLKRLFGLMSPPAYIGLTATTPLIKNALLIADLAKVFFPNSKVIMGGVHPTVEPEESLLRESVDAVVRDEGEETMLEIARGVPFRDILGLSYKENGEIKHNPPRPLIKDLNQIPAPAYHLLPMKKYYPAIGSYHRLPAMSMFATRGCPGRCTFCYRTFGGKVRKRSAENIIEEVARLYKDYGIREISFYDDSFTAFKDVVFRFCELLKEKKLKISWSCFTRADLVNKKLLLAMKQSGCHLILFGVETGDERIMRNINKRISLDKVVENVRFARRIGIDTRASFMLGNQGETEESVQKTIDFALKLNPSQLHFNIATAYPGTELYQWARENGYLLDESRYDYNMSDVNLILPDISPERLKYYYNYAHRKFYLKPSTIINHILRLRTFTQFVEYVKGFIAVLYVFTHKR